ncbi:hypothetical protein BST81_24380 [Leptolyngbya sp. 'hensonii']|uniref:hypothetical protein n=1 Tax=Leptolyngbya sp. 'hensonii' TaxID=1922337 RepID=UPI00094F8AC4|nr:hypothetical protein [Leptolyngbya sp. 'hensonii']OLP15761.1 hypothetical protein BST81_24380 [Leptolyngbya sp. 'hensonii']
MPRSLSEKCRLCAKLVPEQARQLHGPEGDGCWNDKRCHDRRSYYRHRGVKIHNQRQRRQSKQPIDLDPLTTLAIPVPALPAAVIHWYRQTKDSPLHAIGAELWIGNDRVAKIEPVHCLGLTETQVKTLLVRILEGFSQHSGLQVTRFRSAVELHPLNCPIVPCPLHPHT